MLFSGDPSTAAKVFNGAENLKTSIVWAGNEYTAEKTGTVAGLEAVLITKGEKLNGDPKQYVAITETVIDDETGFSQPEHLCHLCLRVH